MSEPGEPKRERIVLLLNSASGRGRAAGVADAITRALRSHGVAVETLDVHDDPTLEPGAQDAIVVVGGDGTLHHSLGTILDADAPVRVVPCGTENLFAREFGWTACVERIVEDVARGKERRVDVALRDGEPFAVMLSVGPDAAVVSRVAANRAGAIRHLSYVRPIIAETLAPTLPRLSVTVDGERIVNETHGWLVVANSRQYAVRIDPAPDARIDDGLLDVVFVPARSGLSAAAFVVCSRLRLRARRRSVVRCTGREVEVSAFDHPAPTQCDGEVGSPIAPSIPVRLTVEAGALRVVSAAT
ncbi:MAG: hypothetical protein EA379_04450 [Phycisphaerales bacterium]|nr:MAG: hypothetical protein EA379_04450 [Phycisphaerales bacterium]